MESRCSEARLKLQQGFLAEALRAAEEGYRYSAKSDPVWSWRFQLVRAEALIRSRQPTEALALLQPSPPSTFPLDILVRRKILQGDASCQTKQNQDGNSRLKEAEQLIANSDRGLIAETHLVRAKCAWAEGRLDVAQQEFRQSQQLAGDSDNFIRISALGNLGVLFFRGGRYAEAVDQFQEVLELVRPLHSPLLEEKTLGNLAECFAGLGDWRRSIALADQAEKLAAQIKNDGDREKWLVDLGRGHFAMAEFSSAEPYYNQALPIARTQNDADAVWRCLNALTQLALKRHDLVTAEKYWQDESALNLGPEGRAYVSFDAAMLAVEKKEFSKAEHLFKELLNSNPKDSLRLTTERELGAVYWQENKIADADRTFREAIKDAEAVIARLPAQYQMSFLDEDPFYDSYVRFLVAQGRSLEGLKVAERGRAQILSQAFREKQGTFDLTAVQAVLKKRGQIALAYSLTNDESFLWVITPKRFRVFSLPSHKTLGRQVYAYNREIVDHPRPIEDSPGGQELYKALVEPAESLIPKGSRVVVICSKMLSLLNFESLVVPGAHPHYWIEDVEVETASSLALLARSRPPRVDTSKSRKGLLLLGAPVPVSDKYPALIHAEEEMQRVRSHFPAEQETIISGKEAVPSAYRASRPGAYRFIHIDAHSVASELNPLDSFVVLSPTANNAYELKASEIEKTPVQADLVTLSACYGAGTRWYQGEGIVGLGWAFLRAGAHQVVASLWTVDDASTPQLMDDFYGELRKGKSAAEALRRAKLNMLHSKSVHSRPFYWASLLLYTGS